MAEVQKMRELLTTPPAEAYWREKAAAGWRLVSVEWERDVPGDMPAAELEEVPFGLQVADDCLHLSENPRERAALLRLMELIVKDRPLSEVAAELNRAGYRTRQGREWTQAIIFEMLPRLIEAGPRILTDQQYVARKVSAR